MAARAPFGCACVQCRGWGRFAFGGGVVVIRGSYISHTTHEQSGEKLTRKAIGEGDERGDRGKRCAYAHWGQRSDSSALYSSGEGASGETEGGIDHRCPSEGHEPRIGACAQRGYDEYCV